ncbi:MAG: YbaK/EbsC family protein [bacterium]
MEERQHNNLVELFGKYNLEYEIIEHEAEGISEKIAAIRGNKPEEGCKSMLLRWKSYNDKGYLLADVPGNLKVNIDGIKVLKGFNELRMATPDEVRNVTKCEIGAVPPFGELFEIESVFDEKLFLNEYLYFNAASLIKSIKIKSSEVKKIIENNVEKYSINNISI